MQESEREVAGVGMGEGSKDKIHGILKHVFLMNRIKLRSRKIFGT